jgi:crotonobetainyl-CoA:carnitine CoA-transferase CaiB-like acyl-CoA transferase
MSAKPKGPLAGIRILEIAGIGPGPFAGMLLADLGAEVIVVERPGGAGTLSLGRKAIYNRGKQSICIDLKAPAAADLILRLLAECDALIEGMRPGVMERLGLGPEVCLARQPKLVYGRMTGWGQSGPWAQCAGHDINYIALSGALSYSGEAGRTPVAPPTLVGDLGGGALYLVVGILAGIVQARAGGSGQVVDAAIVDGSAHLMNLLLAFAAGGMPMERGKGWVDGPYWYGSYRCADGRYLAIGPIEPQFHAEFLRRLGLECDARFQQSLDASTWPAAQARLAEVFARESQAHWCALFDGSDACVAPVLEPAEAACHPHLAARKVYQAPHGVLQAAPAPRFSAHPDVAVADVPAPGANWRQILQAAAMSGAEIDAWVGAGVVSPPA